MRRPHRVSILSWVLHKLLVAGGALTFTALFFLLLPVIQAIGGSSKDDVIVRTVEAANLPPPPPPPPEEEEPPQEEEKPQEQPKLADEPLDLSQLELALNPGDGSGWSAGDLGVELSKIEGGADGDGGMFSLAELDQRPRVIYQPGPVLSGALRKKSGKVYVLFVVDERGRVQSPIVDTSSDPAFEAPALAAVKKWKFEPGKRNGKAVQFRMRVPITFPGQGSR